MTARGYHFFLDTALQQVPLILRDDERMGARLARQPVGMGDLPARVVGAAGITDLALVDQGAEGIERFLDRRMGIGRMMQIDIDVVGAQALQAGLARLDDIAARAARDIALVRAPRFMPHLVTITASWRFFPSALPRKVSDRPSSYMSAVSNRVTPAVERGLDDFFGLGLLRSTSPACCSRCRPARRAGPDRPMVRYSMMILLILALRL